MYSEEFMVSGSKLMRLLHANALSFYAIGVLMKCLNEQISLKTIWIFDCLIWIISIGCLQYQCCCLSSRSVLGQWHCFLSSCQSSENIVLAMAVHKSFSSCADTEKYTLIQMLNYMTSRAMIYVGECRLQFYDVKVTFLQIATKLISSND